MNTNEINQIDQFHKELGELLIKYKILGMAALLVTSEYEIATSGAHAGVEPCKSIIVDVEMELRKMQEAMTGEKSEKVREGLVTPKKREN